MTEQHLVSIIMPAYNAEKYLQEAINSVLAQTYIYWELIIIDDGSTDSTAAIGKKNAEADPRIKYIYQENGRQAKARNLALRTATGKWIAFLDADDIWLPEKLEVQLSQNTPADIIYSAGTIIHEIENSDEAYETEYGFHTGAEMYRKLFFRNRLPSPSIMMKRDLLQLVGYQNEKPEIMGNCEDWEYWIRLAKNGATFFGVKQKLFMYRIHENGASNNKIRMKIGEAFALYSNLDFQLLDKKIIQNRFIELIEPLLKELLYHNKKAEALNQLQILRDVSPNVKYNFADFLLRNSKTSTVWVSYLLFPKLIGRSIKQNLGKKYITYE